MVIKNKGLFLSLFIICLLSACSFAQKNKVQITDAKIAALVDENLMPQKVTNIFPPGTQKVFCWFQWKKAKVNTQIEAKWYFVTDDINILDYSFNLPRKEGSGSVALSMPEGKTLPTGSYRIDLTFSRQILKSLPFKIE